MTRINSVGFCALLIASGLLICGASAHAATYAGNGNTGFGGAIGGGSLTLSDNGTTVSGTVTKGGGGFSDSLVIYIQSGAGGFSSTSGFADANDGLRKSISGFDGGANRSTLTFAAGFAPNYAIALGPNNDSFGGLWQLANGGNNSLPFVSSVGLSPTGTSGASTYSFSFNLSDVGLPTSVGASFELFGTYISDTGYRSTEAVAGNDTGTQGYNPFTQTAFSTYTTVPEPSSLALLGMGALSAAFYLRRKK